MVNLIMPIYDFQCNVCGESSEQFLKIEERHKAVCPTCGGAVRQVLKPSKVILFREGYYDHIGPDPIYCKSMKELREACKEHECYSQYAEDSTCIK